MKRAGVGGWSDPITAAPRHQDTTPPRSQTLLHGVHGSIGQSSSTADCPAEVRPHLDRCVKRFLARFNGCFNAYEQRPGARKALTAIKRHVERHLAPAGPALQAVNRLVPPVPRQQRHRPALPVAGEVLEHGGHERPAELAVGRPPRGRAGPAAPHRPGVRSSGAQRPSHRTRRPLRGADARHQRRPLPAGPGRRPSIGPVVRRPAARPADGARGLERLRDLRVRAGARGFPSEQHPAPTAGRAGMPGPALPARGQGHPRRADPCGGPGAEGPCGDPLAGGLAGGLGPSARHAAERPLYRAGSGRHRPGPSGHGAARAGLARPPSAVRVSLGRR